MGRFEQIRDILWPRGPGPNVWAVLDCARDARIYRAIYDSHNFSACLYSGELTHALMRIAPQLVQLEYDDKKLTKRLFEEGWGENWGIVLRCDAGMDRLRRHFRKFTIVQDERRRNMVFRFYDPRIFRTYLPTCWPRELDVVFGPIEHYWLEGETGRDLIRFERTERDLEQKRFAIRE